MGKFHPRMFIAQSTLEAWLESGNVDVSDQLVVLKHADARYAIVPAVRFLSAVPERAAPGLIGKVLTETRIAELGGELMGDSVLFGEAAFQIEPGYVGTLQSSEAQGP